MTANGSKDILGGDENALKLDYKIVAQLCKYIKHHRIAH